MEARARIPVGPPVANPLLSYWHNPKSPLANVVEPEGDKATQPYDYTIIGSGISGTMIAYNLLITHPQARIVMLEAREACSGATGRNGGHTKAATYRSHLHHVQELGVEEAMKIARLEYANIVETHRIAKDLDIACESQLCDTVDIIYDKDTFEQGKQAIKALQDDATEDEKKPGNLAWYEVHEKSDALEAQFSTALNNTNPAVSEPEEVAGVFRYLAGRIHAYRLTTGILKHCVQNGLQLCTNTPVHSILPSTQTTPDAITPLWDVFTQYSTITTRNVVLTTNGYTPYLLPSFQGAIVPLRGQITAQQPGSASKLPAPLPTTYSFIYRDGYEYMIPRPLDGGGQHIIIGGGLGRLPSAGATEYGTVDDSSLNPEVSSYLHGSLKGYFGAPNWGESADTESPPERIVHEWTGIMGATADGRPFVGEVPGMKGLWVSAGFNGHGMVLCVKAAEALVGKMASGRWPEWFPESFEVSEERLGKGAFRGRTDMQRRE
ncbi:FAD dependent oxidoreductase-like protein [Pyrenochaeta sp. DS3sAY3a]|nr:FAD dependent oxidoreductase-like protein [Pyrenochaeta sp. DS3sAY3a]